MITFIATILIFVFIIGLCFGSFLNVVILRAFSNESICFPGSKCPSCQTPLKWHHNIPVLSYLFLKGKCAFCKEEISPQYPIIELITGLLFVAIFLKFKITFNTIFMLTFASLFVVLAATDIKEKIVFDFHTYILVGIGLIYNFFNFGHLYLGDKTLHLWNFSISVNNSFINALLGILLGIIVMEALARFGYLVAGTRAFGEGDTYIAAGLGAVFGWKNLIIVLISAFIIQLILTIPVFIKKLYTNKDYKTLISFFIFFILMIILKGIELLSLSINGIIFILLTLLLCGVGFYVCKRILSGLRTEQNMTYLPFGPAMVLGGLIMMFII